MILIDSSVWIPFFNAQKNPRVEAMMTLIRNDDDVCLSFHILMEILQGLRVDKVYQQVLRYLLMFPIVDMGGMSSYIAAAQIYRQCRKKGITIRRGMDCIIAQTVVENKLTLLHDDADFDRIASVIPLQIYTENT